MKLCKLLSGVTLKEKLSKGKSVYEYRYEDKGGKEE